MASRSSTSPPGWGPGFPFMLNALCHCDWLKYSMGRPKTTYFSSYSVCKPGNRTPPRAPEASSPAAPLTMPGIRCAYVRGRVACAHKPSVRTPHTACGLGKGAGRTLRDSSYACVKPNACRNALSSLSSAAPRRGCRRAILQLAVSDTRWSRVGHGIGECATPHKRAAQACPRSACADKVGTHDDVLIRLNL